MNFRYFPVGRYWSKRIAPHLYDDIVIDTLNTDFNNYLRTAGQKVTFDAHNGDVPFQFEGCDWHLFKRGRPPIWRPYVKHGACHWLANTNLLFAGFASKRPWRIVTSALHSTVWDGKDTLFDMNMLAFGVPTSKVYAMCFKRPESAVFPVGELAASD